MAMRAFGSRPASSAGSRLWGSPFKITGHPFSFSSSAEADGWARRDDDPQARATSPAASPEVPVWQRCLDGPYGAFTIGNPADMHVLIAGGVGITPMMSMIRTLADRGDKRPLILLYGSKDWESVTFREELDVLAEAGRPDLSPRALEPPEGWTGERGLRRGGGVPAPPRRRPMPTHEYFICGPDVMLDAIEAALEAR